MRKLKEIIILSCLLAAGIFQTANAQLENPVTWSYSAKRSPKAPNEVTVYLKATIDNGWHIYSTKQKAGGPVKTTLSFKGTGYTPIGSTLEPTPIKKFEKVFDMDVQYFENSVIFTQKVKLNGKNKVVKGTVEYMACTDQQCLPPAEVNFSIPVK